MLEGHAADGRRPSSRCGRSSAGMRGEEHAGAVARVCAASMAEVRARLRAEHGFHVASELVEALGAEADAEVVAGDLFQLVRLVEDDGAGGGKDAGIGGRRGLQLDGHVGEEEMVVDDDDVGLERLAPHRGDEAASQSGQVWPRQASPRASSLGHRADSGSATISARSPVSVVFSHAAMGWNCEISSRPESRGESRSA